MTPSQDTSTAAAQSDVSLHSAGHLHPKVRDALKSASDARTAWVYAKDNREPHAHLRRKWCRLAMAAHLLEGKL